MQTKLLDDFPNNYAVVIRIFVKRIFLCVCDEMNATFFAAKNAIFGWITNRNVNTTKGYRFKKVAYCIGVFRQY